MRDLLVRPRARADLLEIWQYIAQDNVAGANAMLERLERAIADLPVNPSKGHPRTDSRKRDYLFWYVRPYLIAYRYDDAAVYVERVIHGRRDLGRAFRRS